MKQLVYGLGNSGQEGKTHYELLLNKIPQINILKLFTSEVYVHVPKKRRSKWDKKGQDFLFVDILCVLMEEMYQ